MRFSHEILPDFDFAICLHKFFKNVHGSGRGQRWDGVGGQGRMRGTEAPRYSGPPCWVVGRKRTEVRALGTFRGRSLGVIMKVRPFFLSFWSKCHYLDLPRFAAGQPVFLSILPFLTLLSPSARLSSFLHSELCRPCDPGQVI